MWLKTSDQGKRRDWDAKDEISTFLELVSFSFILLLTQIVFPENTITKEDSDSRTVD